MLPMRDGRQAKIELLSFWSVNRWVSQYISVNKIGKYGELRISDRGGSRIRGRGCYRGAACSRREFPFNRPPDWDSSRWGFFSRLVVISEYGCDDSICMMMINLRRDWLSIMSKIALISWNAGEGGSGGQGGWAAFGDDGRPAVSFHLIKSSESCELSSYKELWELWAIIIL